MSSGEPDEGLNRCSGFGRGRGSARGWRPDRREAPKVARPRADLKAGVAGGQSRGFGADADAWNPPFVT